MSFTDVIKESVLEGFAYSNISTAKMIITMLIAYAIAMYIHLVYKIATKNAFYYRNYAISMTIMSVITAGIILAMQSSLVISLGMVGALSIVRFRTAIKDPMDLLFLFWAIAVGIICGAGLYGLAILMSVIATIGIALFQILPIRRGSYLLVINALSKDPLNQITTVLKESVASSSIRAKNITRDGMELIIEIKLTNSNEELVDKLLAIDQVESVHLLENDVNVKS